MFSGFPRNVVFSFLLGGLWGLSFAASGEFPQIEKRLARRPLPTEFLPEDTFPQLSENLIGRGEDFELEWVLGTRGSEPGQFLLPTHVELGDRTFWVTDYGNHRIQEYDLKGNFLRIMPFEHLKQPIQTRYSEGRFYVADRDCPCVRVYESDAGFVGNIGEEGNLEGGLNRPNSLALDEKGLLWVSDDASGKVEIFALKKLFGRGSHYFMNIDEYQPEVTLRAPKSLTWSPRNHEMLMVDSGTARVLAFDAEGNYLRDVLSWSQNQGTRVFMPQSLIVDEAGGMYVADHIAHQILKYGPQGQLLGEVGVAGQIPESLLLTAEDTARVESQVLRRDGFLVSDSQLKFPMGMAVTDVGDLLVADWGNNQVKFFSRSYWRKGVQAYKEGKLELAISYFLRCRPQAQAYHLVEFYLAMCHYYLGDSEAQFEQKQEHFHQARSLFETLMLKSKVGRFEDDWIAERSRFYLARVNALLVER